MTLVIAAGNPDFIVQLSDRQLTGSKGPNVLRANKAIVLDLADARFAVGFAGLAHAGRFRTEDWLLGALSAAAPPDYTAVGTLERLVERATSLLEAESSLRRLPKAEQRMSFMFTGYSYSVVPPLIIGAMVSNFQNFDTGADDDEAWDAFRPRLIREKRPAPEDVPTYVQRIGAWPAMGPHDVEEMKELLRRRPPHDAVVEKGLHLVRQIASRPAAQGLVGVDLASITLPSDRAKPAVAGYHPAAAEHQWRGVSLVVAKNDDLRVTAKDLVFRAVDPKPDLPPMTGPRIGRNSRCPCGSGLKYKRCCGA
jgi:hypothetical protein